MRVVPYDQYQGGLLRELFNNLALFLRRELFSILASCAWEILPPGFRRFCRRNATVVGPMSQFVDEHDQDHVVWPQVGSLGELATAFNKYGDGAVFSVVEAERIGTFVLELPHELLWRKRRGSIPFYRRLSVCHLQPANISDLVLEFGQVDIEWVFVWTVRVHGDNVTADVRY